MRKEKKIKTTKSKKRLYFLNALPLLLIAVLVTGILLSSYESKEPEKLSNAFEKVVSIEDIPVAFDDNKDEIEMGDDSSKTDKSDGKNSDEKNSEDKPSEDDRNQNGNQKKDPQTKPEEETKENIDEKETEASKNQEEETEDHNPKKDPEVPEEPSEKETDNNEKYQVIISGLDSVYYINEPIEVTFSVDVLNADAKDNVSISLKGNDTIKKIGPNKYSMTVGFGNNVFEILVSGNKYQSSHYTKNVIGKTKRLEVNSPEEYLGDKDAIKILTSFDNYDINEQGHLVTTTQDFTLNISSSSYSNKLYEENIEVYVNGQKYTNTPTFNSRGEYEYELFFNKGTEGDDAVIQTITIITWDDKGNSRKIEKVIEYNYKAEGSKGGKVSIYIDATTVGYGFFDFVYGYEFKIGQTWGDILFDKNGVLSKYGVSFQNSSDGYLERLGNMGFDQVSMYTIPEALKTCINKDIESGGQVSWTGANSGDSLGEFDYTNKSGWMYEVSRGGGGLITYPGRGFSEVNPVDGDILIIRYTLNMGKDIGSGSYGNYCYMWVNGYQSENYEGHHYYENGKCAVCGSVDPDYHTEPETPTPEPPTEPTEEPTTEPVEEPTTEPIEEPTLEEPEGSYEEP